MPYFDIQNQYSIISHKKAITISVIVFFLKQQKLSDWDTIKSNKYTKAAISYLLYCKNEDCPKDIVIPFEY